MPQRRGWEAAIRRRVSEEAPRQGAKAGRRLLPRRIEATRRGGWESIPQTSILTGWAISYPLFAETSATEKRALVRRIQRLAREPQPKQLARPPPDSGFDRCGVSI